MIILMNGENVSICVKDSDLLAGKKRFYAFSGNGYYDPENGYKPCFNREGEKPRRRLYDGYATEYEEMMPEALTTFDRLRAVYEKKMGNGEVKVVEKEVVKEVVKEVPAKQSGLGSQLEEIMLKVLAEQSVDKVLGMAKPLLDEHIKQTYGVLPQVHEVKTPQGTQKIEGVVHEKFEKVVNLVNADIPVFLTGGAGTGKNVICKQVAKALNLEFYFTNAVTQEYKLTGFIDANGRFHETQFYKAFTEGGLFMLDEIDASIPEVLIILNAAIANRYFDFPTGRVEAHEDFRLIAAGNTFGTGADMEYTGRYQLDAASLDRFALIEISYSPAIEDAIARGDNELTEFIRAFRKAVSEVGMKHLATYRSIERIKKLDGMMDLAEVMEICLLKNLDKDDLNVICGSIKVRSSNRYYKAMVDVKDAK